MELGSRPKVITLCGSTRFKTEYEQANQALTLAGNIVISVGVFVHANGIELSEEQKENLDRIHLWKISMSDEIMVIDVDGYIGTSTKREIEIAETSGKSVRYWSQEFETLVVNECPECNGNQLVYRYWKNDVEKVVMDDWLYCNHCYPYSSGTWPMLDDKWVEIDINEYDTLRDGGYSEHHNY